MGDDRRKQSKSEKVTNQLIAGLTSGVVVAGVFNPWDRALYLSVLKDRDFLHYRNWRRPYKGFNQAILHRTLSGGLYFPFYDIYHDFIGELLHEAQTHTVMSSAIAGNLAGATNGILLNFLTAVKYQSWGTDFGFFHTARKMYSIGGVTPFRVGLSSTITRDMVFGMTYSTLKYMWSRDILINISEDRREVRNAASGLGSLLSALVATIASSPFNYARNMQYGTPIGEKQKSMIYHMKSLQEEMWRETKPMQFLQRRLRIGWGSLRVAVGMGVGNELYDVVKRYLDHQS